ncbi:MAG: folate-binding protein [Geminicoccaceae bacterium]|nr:MAG: folate-binding protein [Geminicoccaceae bacterium]
MAGWTRLADRTVVAAAGADVRGLLQGLISNDLDDLSPTTPLYAALLTPQGKYLFDFIVVERGLELWLDVEASRAADFARRLLLYRLRAKADFEVRDDLAVYAVFDTEAPPPALPADGAAVAAVDPRLAKLGWRVWGDPAVVEPILRATCAESTPEAYDRFRLLLGIPDGSRDLAPDKALLLENGFVELNGVAFDKGCFVGQELTARMKYRATVRKRLLPVGIDGDAEPGTVIRDGEMEVGELRSRQGDIGLALIRLDRWDKAKAAGRQLQADAATVAPWVPSWVDLSFASKTAESSA